VIELLYDLLRFLDREVNYLFFSALTLHLARGDTGPPQEHSPASLR